VLPEAKDLGWRKNEMKITAADILRIFPKQQDE